MFSAASSVCSIIYKSKPKLSHLNIRIESYVSDHLSALKQKLLKLNFHTIIQKDLAWSFTKVEETQVPKLFEIKN